MSETMVFINLPTSDLERAKRFWLAVGGSLNPDFSDEKAACIVFSKSIFFMIVHRDYLQTFTDTPIANPREVAGVLTALTCPSRYDVVATVAAGIAAGGTEPAGRTQDLGFMFSRQLEDPDGNILEFVWMDPAAADAGPDERDTIGTERLAEFGG